jgi:hypothetical protein
MNKNESLTDPRFDDDWYYGRKKVNKEVVV